ncbi:hypothetical protein HK098_006929 [Nowakowskiella sp. JEL0407]|nr:hypothetical protein HK098_006929 [Nowakowskiella sp. JEL0407]
MGFLSAIRTPPIAVLVTAVGLGCVAATGLMIRNLVVDPFIPFRNKRTIPDPWNNMSQNTNLKLYAVNQKFENNPPRGLKSVLEKHK